MFDWFKKKQPPAPEPPKQSQLVNVKTTYPERQAVGKR